MLEAVREAVCGIGPIPYAWDRNAETDENRIDTLETVLGVRVANAKIRDYGCESDRLSSGKHESPAIPR